MAPDFATPSPDSSVFTDSSGLVLVIDFILRLASDFYSSSSSPQFQRRQPDARCGMRRSRRRNCRRRRTCTQVVRPLPQILVARAPLPFTVPASHRKRSRSTTLSKIKINFRFGRGARPPRPTCRQLTTMISTRISTSLTKRPDTAPASRQSVQRRPPLRNPYRAARANRATRHRKNEFVYYFRISSMERTKKRWQPKKKIHTKDAKHS